MPELRVFISSTFRDLQEEREHLIKKIFPEIRALCRERGITFTEVDLRWGLTEENVVLGQVIRTCLEEIDRCRPYFIGITGERYGYIPELMEYYKDADLLTTYPWLQSAAMEESSIIDLEFRHAVLNHSEGEASADGASFFFRRQRRGYQTSVEETEASRLEQLKDRVRASGVAVDEFLDLGSLGAMVYDALLKIIERDFAGVTQRTPLEEERSRHRAFAESRRHAYIPNPDYLRQLNDWYADEGAGPLVLYAESGSGKSSLVSFWCEELRRRKPDLAVIEHYVGIGAGDTDHLGIIQHVMEEIKERYDRDEEIPTKPEELERAFGNWLGFNVSPLPMGERPGVRVPLVLVIDGINQLSGRALDLHWLPRVMPQGVKLIISSTVERTLVDLRQRGWRELGMQPLNEREREAVVVRYLSEYRKALSPEQVARLADDAKCSHPLFLRTVLEELRVDSTHEQLTSRINRYLDTTGTEDLFQHVLQRLEEDYSTRTVREVMSLIWCSRQGLDETDLAELTGVGRLNLSTLLLGLDYHLVRRDGLLMFFHDYLRRAVEKRYLPEEATRRQYHLRLATFFEQQMVSRRTAWELMWAYAQSGEYHRHAAYLGRIEVLSLLNKDAGEWEVLSAWRMLRENGEDIEDIYHRSVEEYASRETPENRLAVYATVGTLFARLGLWGMAWNMYEQMVNVARSTNDIGQEADGERLLARLLIERGEFLPAEQRLEHAQKLYERVGDRRGAASAQGSLGIVYSRRGEYSRALESFGVWLQISEELGDRRSVARAHGSMGIVYTNRGEYDRALESYGILLRMSTELGDRHNVAIARGNMGTVYAKRREYDQAVECLGIWLQISEELGDVHGIASARGNMGVIYSDRGDHDRALECHEVTMRISETLNDRLNVAIARMNMAKAFAGRGENDRALECLRRALDDYLLSGHRYGESYCRAGMATLLVDAVERHETMPAFLAELLEGADAATWRSLSITAAREHAEQSVAIATELETPDILFTGQMLLVRIDEAEGRTDSARQRLSAMLQEADQPTPTLDHAERSADGRMDHLAELHYRLWKLGATDADHRTEALTFYESLFKREPTHEIRERIDELSDSADRSR